ncbi:hypothetical protein BJD20_13155 [Acinetobacter proteolyticus]|uniref:hypothetical protein n=1 Tax=Acinetobacter proteolyticus TaxID=1776741 RepID=UPI000863232C|nr:hypothetical protein [Acinetobacter proteolyticus]OEY96047.1 hypothetical protein BJD20_13155 [Acinetobacter proteolyticus]WEI17399.1 hypothetical protein PY247_12955 [Acinetobacter proteolyticus]
MRDDQAERIKKLSEEIADDMIDTAAVALEIGVVSKQARGDKGFMYKIVKDQAAVMAALERIIAIKEGKTLPISATPETQEKHEQNLIRKAEEEAAKLAAKYS